MSKQIFTKPSLGVIRKSLRAEMPDAEKKLWFYLRGKNLKGYKFRRQHSIESYVVDFYCPVLKLAIEVDGDSHFSDKAEILDRKRQKEIEDKGVRFLRFTNTEVFNNLDEVVEKILDVLP